MEGKLDSYDYVAVLTVGVVFGIGCVLISPWDIPIPSVLDHTEIGAAGALVILAFVVGHIIRIVSAQFEGLFWKTLASGWPTDWIKTAQTRGRLLTDKQYDRLDANLVKVAGGGVHAEPPGAWPKRVREIYAAVANLDRAKRIDMFNRTYGMFAALALVFFVLAVGAVALKPWPYPVALAMLSMLCVRGAFQAGSSYAQELFLQAMLLPEAKTASQAA